VVANILEAATAEFAQYGLGGARVERIVANTHTSKRMVYYHFGSKEALYQAVLEHEFQAVRVREDNFDPHAGSPVEALIRFAEVAFDSLSERPAFVRLITMENLSGAVHFKGSAVISKLNQRGMGYVATIVERGRKAGVMRSDVSALDVFINVVGLCYYHVANRAAYAAGGFNALDDAKIKSDAFHVSRRRAVVETAIRYACVIH
jgi:AcrR family transcriptional regulator